MLADARSRQFDVLVCHKLDRFSRNLVDVLLTLDELQKLNVSFASASEAIDFTTPSGRMMLVMLAFFAEWYLQNLSAETTNKEQRQAMLKEMFEAVYIDPASKKVVGVKPYAEFVPLFQQTRMIEHDYRFVLENETTAQDDCSSERSYVSSGRNGIRIFARREGFRPQPNDCIQIAAITHRLAEREVFTACTATVLRRQSQ